MIYCWPSYLIMSAFIMWLISLAAPALFAARSSASWTLDLKLASSLISDSSFYYLSTSFSFSSSISPLVLLLLEPTFSICAPTPLHTIFWYIVKIWILIGTYKIQQLKRWKLQQYLHLARFLVPSWLSILHFFLLFVPWPNRWRRYWGQ